MDAMVSIEEAREIESRYGYRSDPVSRVVCRLARSVVALREGEQSLRAESDGYFAALGALHEIIAGRTTPPTESVGDRFRAAGERTHVADLEREVLRLRAEAETRAEGDAEVTALRAQIQRIRAAVADLPGISARRGGGSNSAGQSEASMNGSEQQVWRIVDATGAVHEVEVAPDASGFTARIATAYHAWASTARGAVVNLCAAHSWRGTVAEILAPGEMTRAEAVAAARREGAEAMRAEGVVACMAIDAGCITSVAEVCADAIRALPLPGDATPEHATLPAPVCPAPTGAP